MASLNLWLFDGSKKFTNPSDQNDKVYGARFRLGYTPKVKYSRRNFKRATEAVAYGREVLRRLEGLRKAEQRAKQIKDMLDNGELEEVARMGAE